jgi:ATP-binding cassette, subfamily C (CFTR/MRP), member 1
MQRLIREKFSTHTIIAVAHKLDTILDFDRVAMLDGGRVIEFDDPYALLNRESAFSKLYSNVVAEQHTEEMHVEDDLTTPATEASRRSLPSGRSLPSAPSSVRF